MKDPKLLIFIIVIPFLFSCNNGNKASQTDNSSPASNDNDNFASVTSTAHQNRIYVPVYSDIYYKKGNRRYDLAVTLSIRNIDLKQTVQIDQVELINAQGKAVKVILDEPFALKPLHSKRMFVDLTKENADALIITWNSSNEPAEPLVQSIMIGATNTQGISFVCTGITLQ